MNGSESLPLPTSTLVRGSTTWAEQYRPQVLEEIVGKRSHRCARRALALALRPRGPLHMLLHGPPASGKTTTVMLLKKEMRHITTSVIELNASSDRGVESMRQLSRTLQVKYPLPPPPPLPPLTTSFSSSSYPAAAAAAASVWRGRLVILEEADYMTRDAQELLCNVMDDCQKSTRFILVANWPERIVPRLVSRCVNLRFHRPSNRQVWQVLVRVAMHQSLLPLSPSSSTRSIKVEKEDGKKKKGTNKNKNKEYEDMTNSLYELARGTQGDVRRAIHALQLAVCAHGRIPSVVEARSLVGGMPPEESYSLIRCALETPPSLCRIVDRLTSTLERYPLTLSECVRSLLLPLLRCVAPDPLSSSVSRSSSSSSVSTSTLTSSSSYPCPFFKTFSSSSTTSSSSSSLLSAWTVLSLLSYLAQLEVRSLSRTVARQNLIVHIHALAAILYRGAQSS